jgi:hypothetical protein
MNQRILNATQYLRGVGTDVQKDVESVVGPLPAACLTGGQQPVATSLTFGQQPVASQTNTVFAPAPIVRIMDQFGSLFDSTATITVSLIDNTEGATLSGTLARAAQNGTATFTNLTINLPGTYRLRASATLQEAVTVDSAPFDVTQPADIPTSLAFTATPSGAILGADLTPTPVVHVLNGNGDLFTASPVTVSLFAVPTPQLLSLPAGANKRYFVDPDGRPVLLTGTHSSENLQDWDNSYVTDWPAVLRRMMNAWGLAPATAYQPRQNHIRLWAWEGSGYGAQKGLPYPYIKRNVAPFTDQAGHSGIWDFSTTQDCATMTDTSPVQFNQTYFDRLAQRVADAQAAGMYVTVMLFQSWSTWDHGGTNTWLNHWFHPSNNCNGIDGTNQAPYENELDGWRLHSLDNAVIHHIHEEYVKKYIDTLNGYDNVLWEVSNEEDISSMTWQEAIMDIVRDYELTKPKQHLICVSSLAGIGGTSTLMASSADCLAPGAEDGTNPPVLAQTKPSIWDSDHHTGPLPATSIIREFVRGHHPIFLGHNRIWLDPEEDAYHRMQGVLWYLAQRVNLLTMTPQNGGMSPADTGYALVNTATPPYQAIVYQPNGGDTTISLTMPAGTYSRTWVNLTNGIVTTQSNVTNPGSTWTTPSVNADGWALLIRQTTSPAELTLTGTTTRATVNGVASFPTLSLPRTGNVQLWASAPLLQPAMSPAFAVTDAAPAASALILIAPVPTTAVVNVALSPDLVVQVVDQAGLPFVPSPAVNVSLAKASGPGTCTGLGPVATDGSGRATFSSTSCDTAGTVTLTASSGGLTSVTTGNIVITAAPPVATKLLFTTQPLPSYIGATLAPVRVGIHDASDVLMPSESATVTVALTTPGGAVLGGDTQNATSSGVATFSDLTVSKAGTYTLTATAAGLTDAVSSSFAITITPPPTTLLRWPMVEGTGTVLNDTGATGTHDGTLGGTTQAPAWDTGPLGGTTALTFTAAQQDRVSNASFVWTVGMPITVAAWVKTGASTGADQGLFRGGNDAEETFTIGAYLQTTGNQLVWHYGQPLVGGVLSWTWTPNLLGQWTRVAMTGGAGTSGMRIYVNGQLVASNSYVGGPVQQRTGLMLGKHNQLAVDRWLNGSVADFRLIDRPWTEAEALEDYLGAPPPDEFGAAVTHFLGRP